MGKEVRKIWARGLTRSDHGKFFDSPDQAVGGIISAIEYFDNSTVVTYITSVTLPNDMEIHLYD